MLDAAATLRAQNLPAASAGLVQTCDFIAPVCNDAYTYACIAAANSLSDLYAMGAQPFSAMNLLSIPPCCSAETAAALNAGLLDTAAAAGAVCAGGHTLGADSLLAGLSAAGWVEKGAFLSNNTAQIGDFFIATKPLGTAALMLADKAALAAPAALAAAHSSMKTLNAAALAAALKSGARLHACTDITGFGLLGHLSEMLNASIRIELQSSQARFLPGALELASAGFCAAATYSNARFLSKFLRCSGGDFTDDLEICIDGASSTAGSAAGGDAANGGADEMDFSALSAQELVFFSPETSGGLLFATPDAATLLAALHDAGIAAFAIARALPSAAAAPRLQIY